MMCNASSELKSIPPHMYTEHPGRLPLVVHRQFAWDLSLSSSFSHLDDNWSGIHQDLFLLSPFSQGSEPPSSGPQGTLFSGVGDPPESISVDSAILMMLTLSCVMFKGFFSKYFVLMAVVGLNKIEY